MNIPSNLRYTKDHEWVSLDGDTATVGITDFAQKELGDIVYVEVETLDLTLAQDEVFGTVEAVKTVSDLFLPINASSGVSMPLWANSCVHGVLKLTRAGGLPAAIAEISLGWI